MTRKKQDMSRSLPRFILLLLSQIFFNLLLIKTALCAVVDVMIVYDTTATDWVASNGGMEAFSQESVTRMNQALQNSGLNDHSFRLVHSMPVSYTTTSDGSTGLSNDLYPLRSGSGVFAPVHTARNDYGADLVAMMVDTGSAYGYVGVGYLLSSWLGSSGSGFTVNAIQSVNISHTLTHEIGHNLGAHHAKTQSQDPGPNIYLDNEYSAGWYFAGTNSTEYHTIMAYNSDGYGGFYQPAPLFSTPLKTFQGTVAGHASDGDNSRLIDLTIGTVAGYRSAESPYSLSVNSSGATGVAISASPASYSGTSNYSKTDIVAGSAIMLTAPFSSGSATFSSWSGCTATSGNSCTVTMDADKAVTANYTNATYTLSVNSSGASGVAISASPANYGGTSNYSKTDIAPGTSIVLTAPSDSGSATFSLWSGCTATSGNSCTVTMTGDKTVSAMFGAMDAFPWTLFFPAILGDHAGKDL